MSLIIATGSNLNDPIRNLEKAKSALSKIFNLIEESRVYKSSAVEYLDQPDFYNQVLEFKMPKESPEEIMKILLSLEEKLGRVRDIPKGPRIIDLDILFFGLKKLETNDVTVPHPRLFQRSFVVLPLMELPFFETLSQNYEFLTEFDVVATPIAN
ncbi:MAG: 2-amino-4-hydroxy-6-hydroxymethyldihydropteridine diphosphokinase [Bacteriovoracaceae bacterium]|nr:2-amino-4-hydroxy-6-hydroxymethyldihydropteridine diphosphokinase [Bacteriovoracaceae bacterium]